MKYAAWDIEIAKPVPPDTDWKTIRPLGITCASVVVDPKKPPDLFYHGMYADPIEGAMNEDELFLLVEMLLAYHERPDYRLLTWNGLCFDFDVLAEEYGEHKTIAEMAVAHVDMMFHFFCVKGYFLGLNTAAQGMGLQGKTEGMKGDLAPLMWLDDPSYLIEAGHPELADMEPLERRLKTLEYVGQDSLTTLEVALAVEEKGCVNWTSRSGRQNKCELPYGWFNVRDALWIEQPDTSWMTEPKQRSDLYGWAEDAL